MILIRRHINNIVINPWEYVTDNLNGNVLTFENKIKAMEFCEKKDLDIRNDGDNLDESILLEDYGLHLYKTSKEELVEIASDIKENFNRALKEEEE